MKKGLQEYIKYEILIIKAIIRKVQRKIDDNTVHSLSLSRCKLYITAMECKIITDMPL